MKVNISVRVIESLVALYRVFETGVRMDVREVILRYVTNSKVTTHRIIYHLISRGYLETVDPKIGSEITSTVKQSLSELKFRKGISKGPYVGFTIASAVERVVNKYGHIDWRLTKKGLEHINEKLKVLGLSLKQINKPPLIAVQDIRRKIISRFSGLIAISKQKTLFAEPIKVDDIDAARAFVTGALNVLYPEDSERIEPKAGFAISFARDEDAVAESLIRTRLNDKTLWKLLNIEYINPIVTNYRNYLIMYSVSMLYPESYNGIVEFIRNATNWPKLAEAGRAESLDSYLRACIRSGYVIERDGVLEFEDPFIANKSRPRSVIEYLNDTYFASTITATGLLALGKTGKGRSYQLNIKKAVSCMAATLIWQSAYSYPIPIVREREDMVDYHNWYRELKGLRHPTGTTLTFPKVMEILDRSIAIKVLESYISDFLKLLLKGGIIHAIKDPKSGYEVLVPHGIAIKLFNIFRDDKTKETHVSTLIYALKRLLSEKGFTEPLVRYDEVGKVLREEFGVTKEETILHRLRNEGIIIKVGEHYILTPYDLPAVYLDLLRGPSSIVHAQVCNANLLRIVSMTSRSIKEEFQKLLSELENKKSVPLMDFKDVAFSLMDVLHFMRSWGIVKVDLLDPSNPLLKLSDDFRLGNEKYDAKFIIRALREILGWKVVVDNMSINEARAELRDHIEEKDSYEMFESINQLSKENVAEPPYEIGER